MRFPVSEPLADGSARCLVVDADPGVREALTCLLEAQGFSCDSASSGLEALRHLSRDRDLPLVVSDLKVPDLDGFRLLAELHDRSPDAAVILMSDAADAPTAVECMRQGASDFLVKPISLHELEARVTSALEKRALILRNRFYQQHLESRLQTQGNRIKELFLQGVQLLARALEAKDAYTRGHSIRVSHYAVATARAMGLEDGALDDIRLGGELHDIGKIGTREAVLHKPGRLTEAEQGQIREHVTLGEQMLSPLAHESPTVLRCVRSHHERMDGRGFPDGLAGNRIPIEARIIAVADAFDAMTTLRPYRAPLAPEAALGELRRVSGSQLDADVVLAFGDVFPQLQALVPA